MAEGKELSQLNPVETVVAFFADATMTRSTMELLVVSGLITRAELDAARDTAIEAFYKSSALTQIGSRYHLNPEQLIKVAERSRMFISADSVEGGTDLNEA